MKTIKITVLLLMGIFLQTSMKAQDIKSFIDPDSILTKGDMLPQVLLVGSWHFNYPGLDAHQTEENMKVNIFSDRRQKELKELLDYISKFKPTKIAVEGGKNSGYLIRRFERWKNGTRPLGASEIDQIAIRLMDRFGLDTLYGVDAYPLLLEIRDERQNNDTLNSSNDYLDKVLMSNFYGGEDEISKRYSQYYKYKDTLEVQHPLLETFKYMNSEKVLNRGFGAYLNGYFKQGDSYEGVDGLAMNWINRNLRIYRNIQNIDFDENDRILVLFGSAHIQLLNFFFEASPEFRLIKFNELENN